MEISVDVFEKLKCSICLGYLSIAPVFINAEGKSYCGYCKIASDQDHRMRNTNDELLPKQLPISCNIQDKEKYLFRDVNYEVLAKQILFPCNNQNKGCQMKIKFGDEDHISRCKYRTINCPVVESEACDWSGTKYQCYEHITSTHPDKLKENSCNLQQDISKASQQTFLLIAFNVLFLLHTKICLSSKTIYHTLQILGETTLATNFTLTFQKGNRKHKNFSYNNAIEVSMNNLPKQTSKHNYIIFNISVNELNVDINSKLVVLICAECHVKTVKRQNKDNEWRCDSCAPKRLCENSVQGCTYKDIEIKCRKHETIFCDYLTECAFKPCRTNLSGLEVIHHYMTTHDYGLFISTNIWCFTFDKRQFRRFYAPYYKGIFFEYVKEKLVYKICMYTTLTSEEVADTDFIITLFDVRTKKCIKKNMDVKFRDYSVEIKDESLISSNIIVTLDVVKK